MKKLWGILLAAILTCLLGSAVYADSLNVKFSSSTTGIESGWAETAANGYSKTAEYTTSGVRYHNLKGSNHGIYLKYTTGLTMYAGATYTFSWPFGSDSYTGRHNFMLEMKDGSSFTYTYNGKQTTAAAISVWSDTGTSYSSSGTFSKTIKLDAIGDSGAAFATAIPGAAFVSQNGTANSDTYYNRYTFTNSYTVTESSPLTVLYDDTKGSVSVNSAEVANQGQTGLINTGADVVLTMTPKEGWLAASVTYGGETYLVSDNTIKLSMKVLASVTVNFEEETPDYAIMHDDFNNVTGISDQWEFSSVDGKWNAANKSIVQKKATGVYYPMLRISNIAGAYNSTDTSVRSKIEVFYKPGITLRAGATYEIAYSYGSRDLVTDHSLILSTNNAGIQGTITKEGASPRTLNLTNMAFQNDVDIYTRSSGDENAKYTLKIDTINESKTGVAATKTFGFHVEGRNRADGYTGVAWDLYQMSVREFSPISVSYTGQGNVFVNGAAVASGSESELIETGAPVTITFSPANGYQVTKATYAGQEYPVEKNQLSVNMTAVSSLSFAFEQVQKPNAAVIGVTGPTVQTDYHISYEQNGEQKEYTGISYVCYGKLNDYAAAPKAFGFTVTDTSTGEQIQLPSASAPQANLAFGIRIFGQALDQKEEERYAFVPFVIQEDTE